MSVSNVMEVCRKCETCTDVEICNILAKACERKPLLAAPGEKTPDIVRAKNTSIVNDF